jgi:hypothetical protein
VRRAPCLLLLLTGLYRTHAADVLRNVHVIMSRGGLAAAGLGDDLAVLATYLAAVSSWCTQERLIWVREWCFLST